jgi:hypothetical protein
MRLAATGARDSILIAADQLLEFRSTVVTEIFVNRHMALGSLRYVFLILAQVGGGRGVELNPFPSVNSTGSVLLK